MNDRIFAGTKIEGALRGANLAPKSTSPLGILLNIGALTPQRQLVFDVSHRLHQRTQTFPTIRTFPFQVSNLKVDTLSTILDQMGG